MDDHDVTASLASNRFADAPAEYPVQEVQFARADNGRVRLVLGIGPAAPSLASLAL